MLFVAVSWNFSSSKFHFGGLTAVEVQQHNLEAETLLVQLSTEEVLMLLAVKLSSVAAPVVVATNLAAAPLSAVVSGDDVFLNLICPKHHPGLCFPSDYTIDDRD